MLLFTIMTCA